METRDTEAPGTCLIAGCGYVGTRLAARLRREGPVLALVRRAEAKETLRTSGIPARVADFDQALPAGALELPAELRAIFYLAPPAGPGSGDGRLGHFLAALGTRQPEVFVYLSTTGVYGDTGGAPVDEDSPVAPGEGRARQRLDAEAQVARWCGSRGIRWVVFRVPAIYGPHRLPLERLQRGEPVLRDADSGPGNRIQVDDLVAACGAALAPSVAGVFNLTDGDPRSMAAFTICVARLAGLPPPRRVTWAEASAVMSPGLLTFLRESRRITSRRSQELGWTPGYGNPDDGIRASLVEMGWARKAP